MASGWSWFHHKNLQRLQLLLQVPTGLATCLASGPCQLACRLEKAAEASWAFVMDLISQMPLEQWPAKALVALPLHEASMNRQTHSGRLQRHAQHGTCTFKSKTFQ